MGHNLTQSGRHARRGEARGAAAFMAAVLGATLWGVGGISDAKAASDDPQLAVNLQLMAVQSDDGAVPGEIIEYGADFAFAPGPARTAEVTFEVPQFLELDRELSPDLCFTSGAVTGTVKDAEEWTTCTFDIAADTAAQVRVPLYLRAIETDRDEAVEQVLSMRVGAVGVPSQATVTADPVTVLPGLQTPHAITASPQVLSVAHQNAEVTYSLPVSEAQWQAVERTSDVLELSLDACVTDLSVEDGWQLASELSPGSRCGTPDAAPGSASLAPAAGADGATEITDVKITAQYDSRVSKAVLLEAKWQGNEAPVAVSEVPVSRVESLQVEGDPSVVSVGEDLGWKVTADLAPLTRDNQPQSVVLSFPGNSESDIAAMLGDYSGPTQSAAAARLAEVTVTDSEGNTSEGTEVLCGSSETNPFTHTDDIEWDSECGLETTAIKVTPDTDSSQKPLTINLSLTPNDNVAGDQYLLWAGTNGDQPMVAPPGIIITENTQEDAAATPFDSPAVRATGDADVKKDAAQVTCDPSDPTDCDVSWNILLRNTSTTDFTGATFTDTTSNDVFDVEAYIGESVVQVSDWGEHSLALTGSGEVYAWGNNGYGQLGDGTTTNRSVPVRVLGGAQGGSYLSDVVQVSAGSYHSLALTASGEVYAWGRNDAGELGNGRGVGVGGGVTTNRSVVPVRVLGGAQGGTYLSDVVQVSAGIAYSLALTASGEVFDWGRNSGGGSGADSVPVQVLGGAQGGSYLSDVVQVSSGYDYSLALTASGEVYAWGSNQYGQLGDGTNTYRSVPVRVLGGAQGGSYLSDVVQVSAGYYHSLALTASGEVYAWGYNNGGVVGDGTTTNRSVPVRVLGGAQGGTHLSDVVQVSGGGRHSLVLTASGEVYAWGRNDYGQLGDATTTHRYTPVRVLGGAVLSDVVQVSGGYYHSLALTASGEVYAWGSNQYSQLGDGTTTNSSTPVKTDPTWNGGQAPRPLDVASETANTVDGSFVDRKYVAADASASNGNEWLNVKGDSGVLVRLTGKVKRGAAGKVIGNQAWFTTDQAPRSAPNVTPALPTFNSSDPWAYGNWTGNSTCTATDNWESPGDACDQVFASVDGLPPALLGTITGTVWDDTLGNGRPAAGSGVAGVTVSAWDGASSSGGSIVDTTTTAADGSYSLKVLGSSTTLYYVHFDVSTAAAPASGSWKFAGPVGQCPSAGSCAGALGIAGPIVAEAGDIVRPVNAGLTSVVADVKKDAAQVVCDPASSIDCDVSWNIAVRNKTAAGLTGGEFTDTTSNEVFDVEAYIGEPVVQVSAGYGQSLALTSSGEVYAWGYNNRGQLGDGTTTNSLTPVQVLSGGQGGGAYLSDVVQVSAGNYHSLALTSSGEVYAWGGNVWNQLGDDTTNDSSLPVRVLAGAQDPGNPSGSFLSQIVQVAAGPDSSLAVTASGDVYSWGGNIFGQLGDGTLNVQQPMPVRVAAGAQGGSYLSDIAEVSAGDQGSMAVTRSGQLYTWGSNTNGQLGDGTTTDRLTPVRVLAGAQGSGAYLSNVAHASGGLYFSVAVTGAGDVYAWGSNTNGQLGDGTTTDRLTPVRVLAGAQGGTAHLSDIQLVSSSRASSLALTRSGEVYAWGQNRYGRLGDGTTTDRLAPVQVVAGAQGGTDLSGVVQLDGGQYHSVAVTRSGQVYAWGSNANGQLGNSTTTDRSTPVLTDPTWLNLMSAGSEVPSAINGNFVDRKYVAADASASNGNEELDVRAGSSSVIRVTGKVKRGLVGYVVGNQAWFVSDQAGRSVPGLSPALPVFNPASPWAFGNWTGNATCTATDSWDASADACDQVFASVDAAPPGTVGEISGVVWDNTTGSGTPSGTDGLSGVTVKLYKGGTVSGGTISGGTLVDTTVTDTGGAYTFLGVSPGTDYRVVFDTASAAAPTTGGSWSFVPGSGTCPDGGKSCVNSDGIAGPLTVVVDTVLSPVNAAVVSMTVGMDVVKGWENPISGTLEGAAVVNSVPWTDTVTVRAENTGTDALTGLTFDDSITGAGTIDWDSCEAIGASPAKSVTFGGALPLAIPFDLGPGEVLSCTGELEMVSAGIHDDTVTIAGAGAVTGVSISENASFRLHADPGNAGIDIVKGILVDAGTASERIEPSAFIDYGTSKTVTVRVTNTGPVDLFDPHIIDTHIAGPQVSGLTCAWPVDFASGRDYLPAGGSPVDCTGTLTMNDLIHEDSVIVNAWDNSAGQVVMDRASFNATSSNASLPRAGGIGIWTWVILGCLVFAGALGGAMYVGRNPRHVARHG